MRRSRIGLAFLGALGVAAVVAIASGSAATTTKPYTADFEPPSVAGGTTAHITLTIQNNANPQPLGSSNVTAPTGFTITASSFTSAPATATIDPTSTSTLLKLRNLNLAPGAPLAVDLTVTTPCTGGSYTWAIRSKQSNDFNGPPGNDFSLQEPDSNLVTSVTGGCRLAWGPQPTTTKVNTLITNAPYNPNGTKVTVRAVDGNDQTITTINGLTVTLNQSGGTFTSTGTGFTGTTATLVDGVATFASPPLQSDRTGSGFMFYASAPGFTSSPNSDPFSITLTGGPCNVDVPGCPTFSTTLLNNTTVDASATGDSFTFLGISNFTLPDPLPAGCASYKSAGGGFEATEGRTSDQGGDLRFTYYINKKQIEKLYGKTSGQQFIPLCAGAARLDNGAVVKCTSSDPTGWLGKELGPDGRFTGNTKRALCDTATGLFWGILGSHQDYNSADPIDPNENPTVTGWDSNATYRYFHISVPYPWDWKMG